MDLGRLDCAETEVTASASSGSHRRCSARVDASLASDRVDGLWHRKDTRGPLGSGAIERAFSARPAAIACSGAPDAPRMAARDELAGTFGLIRELASDCECGAGHDWNAGLK